jgi:MYXO-CTERM domain-containing protein
MSIVPVFLADEETAAVLASWRISDPATRERVMIFGAIGFVALLALVWAAFLRKKRRRRHSRHHSHRQSSSPAEKVEVLKDQDAPPVTEPRQRSRRSRRRHRPRNPTLAETGGLPPVRPESPPESPL